ncbi:MAG TPA: oligosaccharide flippase family protein [Thermoanaerobaculia bacterium]|nr:oligosaccharide flippase family protein [Thermoanaerobaculia bacterium]
MLRRKIITDTLFLNAGSLVSQVLVFLQGLIVLKMLEPRTYGVWVAVNVVLRYGTLAQAGLENGMAIRLPYHRGRGDTARVELIAGTSFVLWTLIAAAAAAAVALFATFSNRFQGVERYGLFVVALLILLEQQLSFLTRWETAVHMNFRRPALMGVLRQSVTFAFVVPLTWKFGLRGLMTGVLAAWVVTWAVYLRRSNFAPRFAFSKDAATETFRNGFPLFVTAIGGTVIETIDRALVGSLLGAVALGYYGLTTLGGNALFGLLRQAGGALSPHIVAEMGRSRDDLRALDRFLRPPTIVFAYAGAALMSALMIGVPTLVRAYLPKYIPGIDAFYWYVPGFFFLGIILTANNILNLHLIATEQRRIAIFIQLAAIAVEAGGAVLLIRLGLGIAGVAMASTASYVFYGCFVLWWAARFVIPERRIRLAFFGAVALPFFYALAGAWIVSTASVAVAGNHVGRLLAAQVLFGILLWLPPMWLLNRRYAIAEVIGRKRRPAVVKA